MKDLIKKAFRVLYIDRYEPTFMEVYIHHLLILYILIKLG